MKSKVKSILIIFFDIKGIVHKEFALAADVPIVKYHFRNENVAVSFNTFQANDNELLSLNKMYIFQKLTDYLKLTDIQFVKDKQIFLINFPTNTCQLSQLLDVGGLLPLSYSENATK
jgi:hypothetical protein